MSQNQGWMRTSVPRRRKFRSYWVRSGSKNIRHVSKVGIRLAVETPSYTKSSLKLSGYLLPRFPFMHERTSSKVFAVTSAGQRVCCKMESMLGNRHMDWLKLREELPITRR